MITIETSGIRRFGLLLFSLLPKLFHIRKAQKTIKKMLNFGQIRRRSSLSDCLHPQRVGMIRNLAVKGAWSSVCISLINK